MFSSDEISALFTQIGNAVRSNNRDELLKLNTETEPLLKKQRAIKILAILLHENIAAQVPEDVFHAELVTYYLKNTRVDLRELSELEGCILFESAISSGNSEVIFDLLKNAQVTVPHLYKGNPILFAVMDRCDSLEKLIPLFVSLGVDVNVPHSEGYLLLQEAVNGPVEVFDYVLSRTKNIDEPDPRNGLPVIVSAASKDDIGYLDAAIKNGCNIKVTYGEYKESLLACTVNAKKIDHVNLLLKNGLSPFTPNEISVTPFDIAITHRYFELIVALSDYRDTPYCINLRILGLDISGFVKILIAAITDKKAASFNILLNNMSLFDRQLLFAFENAEKIPLFIFFCQLSQNCPEIIEAMLNAGANPDAATVDVFRTRERRIIKKPVYTALHHALETPDTAWLVEKLIHRGANLHIETRKGLLTFFAVSKQNLPGLKVLAKYGARLNAVNASSNLLFFHCINVEREVFSDSDSDSQSRPMSQFLLDHPSASEWFGPLNLFLAFRAVCTNTPVLLTFLAEKGANLTYIDPVTGKNSFHFVKSAETVSLLMAYKNETLNINHLDVQGKSPLFYASSLSIARTFLKYGADPTIGGDYLSTLALSDHSDPDLLPLLDTLAANPAVVMDEENRLVRSCLSAIYSTVPFELMRYMVTFPYHLVELIAQYDNNNPFERYAGLRDEIQTNNRLSRASLLRFFSNKVIADECDAHQDKRQKTLG